MLNWSHCQNNVNHTGLFTTGNHAFVDHHLTEISNSKQRFIGHVQVMESTYE